MSTEIRESQRELGEQLNVLVTFAYRFDNKTALSFDSQLQPAGFRVLRCLYSFGALKTSALAQALATDPAVVSRLLVQLKNLDYVTTEVGEKDKRESFVSLTEKGREKTSLALEQRAQDFAKQTKAWNDEDLRTLTAFLRRFNESSL